MNKLIIYLLLMIMMVSIASAVGYQYQVVQCNMNEPCTLNATYASLKSAAQYRQTKIVLDDHYVYFINRVII